MPVARDKPVHVKAGDTSGSTIESRSETLGPLVTLDPWSTDVFDSSPFIGYRDLLGPFAQSPVWPTLADLEAEWLVARGVCAVNGDPLRLIAQPPRSRRARPRSR